MTAISSPQNKKNSCCVVCNNCSFLTWIGIGSKLVRAFFGQRDFGDALTVVRTGVGPPAPGAAVAAPAESGDICADTLISGDDSPLVAQEPVTNLVAGRRLLAVREGFVLRHRYLHPFPFFKYTKTLPTHHLDNNSQENR